MRTIKKLTLVLSVAALSCASAHGMFRGIGNAVGNVMSQSERMTTNTLDYATQAPGRLAEIQNSSGLVHRSGQGGIGIWRQPIQDRAILSGVGTPAYLQEADEVTTLPYFGE